MTAKTTEKLISELLDQRNIFEDALCKIRDTTWCLCKSGKDCPYCLAKNALDIAYQAKIVATTSV